MIEVSVVIPAYNEEILIQRCLHSLINQNYPRQKYEIIVVDNASSDKTGKIASKYADKVIYESIKGLMHARKRGFDAAQGEIILRTDADAFVPQDWISRAVKIFKNHRDIDAISGFYQIDEKEAYIRNALAKAAIKAHTISFQLRGTIFWLSGPCSGFRKDFYHKIGGFNEKIDPVIADQLEIAYRANEFGKVYFDPHWNSIMSGRRSKPEGLRKLPGMLNDYLIYQGLNMLLFLIFRKQIFKILGRGWTDIRKK